MTISYEIHLPNYNLKQLIDKPTSFTEHSSTLIDLFITNVPELIEHCDVGDPFLDVNVRYHCPIFGMLKITKPKISSFKRKIWIYDKGNYQLYREKFTEVNWDLMINTENNINDMATKLTNKILEISSETISNKVITVRQNDLPWINNNIRKLIRKRDRIRRKAKKNKNEHSWAKFRAVRNKVVNVLRNAKAEYYKKFCDKLKENKFSSKNC